MRIAVCDTSTGDLNILLIDKETEEIFNTYDNVEDFFEDLGYDMNYISWMIIDGVVQEFKVTHALDMPIFED